MSKQQFAFNGGISKHFLQRAHGNVGDVYGLMKETLRNAQVYGKSSMVKLWIENYEGKPAFFIFEPSGAGFTVAGLENFSQYGKSESHGSGHGGRGSAWTIGKRLIVYTKLQGDGRIAHFDYEQDVFEKAQQERTTIVWNVDEAKAFKNLPSAYATGTLFIITNLDPKALKKLDDVEVMRPVILRILYPMRTMTVYWRGTKGREVRIDPPPIEGELVYECKQKKLRFGPGTISMTIKIVVDARLEGIHVVHSTPLATFADVLSGIYMHNRALWGKIAEVVRSSGRSLSGLITLSSLDQFQTQGQTQISTEFYTSELCEGLVDFLNTEFAPAAMVRIAEYNDKHKVDIVENAIQEICRMYGGESSVSGKSERMPTKSSEPPKTPSKILMAKPAALELYPFTDHVFRLYNTTPEVTYTWDIPEPLILVEKSDDRATIGVGMVTAPSRVRVTIKSSIGETVYIQIALRRDPKLKISELHQRPFTLPARAIVRFDHPDTAMRETRIRVKGNNSSVSPGPFVGRTEGTLMLVQTEIEGNSTIMTVAYNGPLIEDPPEALLIVTCATSGKEASCAVEFESYVPPEQSESDEDEEMPVVRPRNIVKIGDDQVTIRVHGFPDLCRSHEAGVISVSTSHSRIMNKPMTEIMAVIMDLVIDHVAALRAEREMHRQSQPFFLLFAQHKSTIIQSLEKPMIE